MKVIIVDNQMLARQQIATLVKNVNGFEIIQECSNGRSAISEINELKPDLIFLDIDLNDINGFQVLQNISIDPKPTVVFLSAHYKHALKAFDFGACDFLLKPIEEKRFSKTVQKILDRHSESTEIDQKKYSGSEKENKEERKFMSQFSVREGNTTILLKTSTIHYILASGYYAEIYTKDKKHVIRESISNLVINLNEDDFCKVNRSAIVSIEYIQEIVHSNYSEIDVRMKDNKLIRITKSHKKDFLKKIAF